MQIYVTHTTRQQLEALAAKRPDNSISAVIRELTAQAYEVIAVDTLPHPVDGEPVTRIYVKPEVRQ